MGARSAVARRSEQRAPADTPGKEPFFYGGQAVIEGVLMRGPRHWACAARRPDGEIVLIEEPLNSAIYTSRFWAQPLALRR